MFASVARLYEHKWAYILEKSTTNTRWMKDVHDIKNYNAKGKEKMGKISYTCFLLGRRLFMDMSKYWLWRVTVFKFHDMKLDDCFYKIIQKHTLPLLARIVKSISI